jgi:cytochrome c
VASVLAAATVLLALAPVSQAADRPRDPWVYRCVLDDNARMVVVALAEDLSVAYDAKTGGLALAWAGSTRLQGAVYDTTHGPQPVHDGERLLIAADGPSWMLAAPGGEPVPATVMWRGYRLDADAVHLRFRLSAPGIDPVEVIEIPEVLRNDDGEVALERRFRVEGGGTATPILVAPRRPSADGRASLPAPLESNGPRSRRGEDGTLRVTLMPERETVVILPVPPTGA